MYLYTNILEHMKYQMLEGKIFTYIVKNFVLGSNTFPKYFG